MCTRWRTAVAIAILAIVALALWVREGERRARWCEICARPIPAATAFSLESGARSLSACCPRCGLSLLSRSAPRRAETAVATDFSTGLRGPAAAALYVDGSDTTPCCPPGTILVGPDRAPCDRCFDRCSPSLVAFFRPEDAAAFAERHGGRIVTLETLLAEGRRKP